MGTYQGIRNNLTEIIQQQVKTWTTGEICKILYYAA